MHISPLDETEGKTHRKDIDDQIYKHVDYPNLEFEFLYATDAFEALKIYFGKSNTDLIAMLDRKRRGGTSKIFHRDLVKRMETYRKIPLLSFRATNYGIFHI